jgi:hypothetical protein
MEQELDARTRELNRTQEELVTSNQLSSDLNERLEELQRHCSTLEEQRFLLGLWGPWERCWCSIAKAHPHVPIADQNLFISVLAKASAFILTCLGLRPSTPSPLTLSPSPADAQVYSSKTTQDNLIWVVKLLSTQRQNSLLRPGWSSCFCFWKPRSLYTEINLVWL